MSNKICKLILHQRSQQKNYAGEDLAFSPKDFPNLEVNDVIEIYNPEEEDYGPRLLLHVSKGSLREDFPQKDAVSIETSIATTFQLRSNSDIVVNKVKPSDVELDSIELTFRDQYLGRSEMFRLKNSLINTCVYLNKKIEFCQNIIRCQVYELWNSGIKVTSGLVKESTKIVFRSSSSMVYLFIQMSKEMWEFDIHGDLYFEKAVNGFLGELFNKWRKNGSSHEVTIVLFSRVYFFGVKSLDQFPLHMRDCIQIDHKKRFYEDFYRVTIQNEKMDDWNIALTNLRQLFVHYEDQIHSSYRGSSDQRVPKGTISSAAQGNFLEVLNMSLNVFEKHYLDRSFDRTGQLSVVVTPGVGVFEVDRELTNITMQRIIDNGVGSDLVCVGEQPLHAVPLLKFHSKGLNNKENYSMPHWINLSFYSTNKRHGYSSYVPRIKLPLLKGNQNTQKSSKDSKNIENFSTYNQNTIPKLKLSRDGQSGWPNSIFDYDDYDNNIFSLPNPNSTHQGHNLQRRAYHHRKKATNTSHDLDSSNLKHFRRQNSEPEMHFEEPPSSKGLESDFSTGVSGPGFDYFRSESRERDRDRASPLVSHSFSNSQTGDPSPAISIPATKHLAKQKSEHLYSASFGALNIEFKPKKNIFLAKDRLFYDDFQPTGPASKLYYSPSGTTTTLDSPKELRPIFTQQQMKNMQRPSRSLINPFDPSHAVIKLTSNRRRWTHIFPRGPSGLLIQEHHHSSKLEMVPEGSDSPDSVQSENSSIGPTAVEAKIRTSSGNYGRNDGRFMEKKRLTLLWGATGEQEWNSNLRTGVDWKSLTIPACLPITTDFLPDPNSLDLDYVVSDYSLLPDDVNADYYSQFRAVYRTPLNTKEVFYGLVSQRLAQGFQLIIPHKDDISARAAANKIKNSDPPTPLLRTNTIPRIEEKETYFMSIGRIFHKLSLTGGCISVTRYRPKHPYPSLNIHYRYRFQAPHNETYEVSWASFATEKLENYDWNYIDNYICTRGDREYPLFDNLKFWRFRIYILPQNQSGTKKILDGSEYCNVYTDFNIEEKMIVIDGFLKFIEICINRIKRPNEANTRTRGSEGGVFRERVGSNRMTESQRPIIKKGAELPELEHGNLEANDDSVFVQVQLKANASLQQILEALRSPTSGFSFISSSPLPKWTFVAADAVCWLMDNMEDMYEAQAVEKFNEMLNANLICHASGDPKHPFYNGFYLYFLVPSDPKEANSIQFDDVETFTNEWMEIELESVRLKREDYPEEVGSIPNFRAPLLSSSIEEKSKQQKACIFKEVFVDIDVGKKSDRAEWGHLKYQSLYRPEVAYEFNLNWIQGTGSVITDLVQQWARKAQQCNLQLIPIPFDPFSLPYTPQSDSLRGPIFILLNIESLLGNRTYLFEEFPESTWDKRMFLFQESIILQFGFIKCSSDNMLGAPRDFMMGKDRRSSRAGDYQAGFEENNYYVHISGNMFILIPIKSPPQEKEPFPLRRSSSSVLNSSKLSGSNLHDDYITRHYLSGEQNRTGFLWSWNYMVSKRWKTSATLALGDDSFMDKMRKDFQSFCQNDQNRLKNYWDACTTRDSKPIFQQRINEEVMSIIIDPPPKSN